MVLKILFFEREPAFRSALVQLLTEKTGQTLGYDQNRWFEWLWSREPGLHPRYADFKSGLYGRIDPRFARYFSSSRTAKIRLDEILWGGVRQDGIPPLRQPKMISASKADYLAEDNVVFGLEVNGDVRAYPRRILAWHEMFMDDVGGVPVAGVYCTLCGSMILYKTVHKGISYSLGSSGQALLPPRGENGACDIPSPRFSL
jgi:hypothetical protein